MHWQALMTIKPASLPLTRHATVQMTRRRIRVADVELALTLGHEHHAAGATFYTLRARDIPEPLGRDGAVRRAEGTTVVVAGDAIVTVYRNRDIRHLRIKCRYDRRPRDRHRWDGRLHRG